MDLDKLYCTAHWLEYSSFTLNTENYILLKNSLLVLQNENHLQKIFFWGVIQSVETDYYIAFGYNKDAIMDKIFFYSEDCQNWKLLPVPQNDHLALSELCKKPFQGDPGLVIDIVDDVPPEDVIPIEQDINLEEALTGENLHEKEPVISTEKLDSNTSQTKHDNTELKSITSGELKEEDRLAATVQTITEETATVPRGGIFKQTDGVNVHSRAFEGLSIDDADELCSFQHYRKPQQEWNTNLLNRVDYNYAIDFLDTVDKDIPLDCWTAQLVEGDRVIILRNLHWPGFMFFHHLRTPEHGCIYVGSGQRNLDIPFMTQVNVIVEDEVTVQEAETSIKRSNLSTKNKGSTLNVTGDQKIEIEENASFQQVKAEPDTEQEEIEGEIITSA